MNNQTTEPLRADLMLIPTLDKIPMNTIKAKRRLSSNLRKLCNRINGRYRITEKEATEATKKAIVDIFEAGYTEVKEESASQLIEDVLFSSCEVAGYAWRVSSSSLRQILRNL